MQPDLMGLEITRGELRRLIGVNPNHVLRPAITENREQLLGFLLKEVRETLLLSLIVVGLIYALIILPTIGSSILLGIALLITVSIAVVIGRWFWRHLLHPKTLKILLIKVDNYHELIQVVDNHDQLALSEQSEMNSKDRETAIAALQLLREDLVRALKSERFLRDNKRLPTNNQELFVNHLETLRAMSVSTQAGEYAQILNQSLQIDLDVQDLVRKLQSPR